MPQTIKRILLGRPLASEEAGHQLLRKRIALPVFASDALSSNAYATEEMMLVLVLAGTGQFTKVMPITFAICALLAIVIFSYRQTVRAYPQGGGSYIVSRSNLGEIPGLVAAAALLVDYVLTVSVSVVAGAAAITSAAPGLEDNRVALALVFILVITVMNLRGVKESGTIFAVPTYAFIVLVFTTIVTGLVRCAAGCPTAETANLQIEPEHALTIFLLLRAFSSGATALTGVEAIADGVAAFRRPQAANAAKTLGVLGVLTISMFSGISFLATRLHVRPITEHMVQQGVHHKTIVAQIAETVFGGGFLFFLVQAATALILILAANTAYQDFPRLSSILARDRYMPRQFLNRGDRLVFSNGVIMLALMASLLVVVFDAQVTRLIQLYVVGVFTSFTLSQAGMVRRFAKTKEPGWQRSALVSGVGATVTFVVLIIVTATKFLHGAYIVVASIPVLVLALKTVNRHYGEVGRQLRLPHRKPDVITGTSVVLLAQDLSTATLRGIGYALSLRPSSIRAVHIGRETGGMLQREWESMQIRFPLHVVPDDKDLSDALRGFIRECDISPTEVITVIIPETLPGKGPLRLLRQRKMLLLKASLLFEPRVVVTDIPQERSKIAGVGEIRRPETPTQNIAVVLVSAVHNASLHAVAYAEAINPSDLRGVTFALDARETEQIINAWVDAVPDTPLEILESPFREVVKPLVRFVRRQLAENPGATVTVVLPEFVVNSWWHQFLHNQTALRIKAALLYEPNVVLTSVPYHFD